MGILRNLFSGKRQTTTPPQAASGPPTAKPISAEDKIRVFDEFGRELWISKDEWRRNVLPGALKERWNDPAELYCIVVSALRDGFRSDLVEAAKHLHEIDPDPIRSACVWGIVLKEEGRLDEAERVFRDHIAQHGEEGSILTNLAKVFSKRKDEAKVDEILWHALEIDPNQDNGCHWYEARAREQGGPDAGLAAWRRIAALLRAGARIGRRRDVLV
jgi:tetratricopeptide (TPR) repeat protein